LPSHRYIGFVAQTVKTTLYTPQPAGDLLAIRVSESPTKFSKTAFVRSDLSVLSARKEERIKTMDREQALGLLREHVKNENMLKHCLASEAVMRSLARELGQDEDRWSLAGLLHDLDVEITDADLSVHGREAVRILNEHGIDPEIVDAIRLHNEEAFPGEKRSTPFQHALAAGETVTGLITATALVYPDKKLSSVKASSVVKRMKEKAFARSVNRDIVMECEKFGVELSRFVEISLGAMREISNELGL